MKFAINLDTLRIHATGGSPVPLTAVEMILGSAEPVEITAFRGTTPEILDTPLQLGIKAASDYAGDFIAYISTWTQTGDTFEGVLNLNTVEAGTLLGTDASADILLEIAWGDPERTAFSIAGKLRNDLIKGTEGVPTGGTPAYPQPANIMLKSDYDPDEDGVVNGMAAPVVSSGALSALTSPQQTAIAEGSIVTTTDGKRWVYSGTGSKVLEASYVQLSDITITAADITDAGAAFAAFAQAETAAAQAALLGLSPITLLSGANRTSYSTFGLAYTAAASGDIIIFGPGTFAIGAVNIDKSNITIRGSGSDRTTLTGTIGIYAAASGVTLENFGLLNTSAASANTFFMNHSVTDTANFTARNLKITATAAGNHVAEFSGDGLTLDRVATKASDAAHGHLFVLKGAKNVVSTGCSSAGNGRFNNLLCKSDVLIKGESTNISVQGFVGVGASMGALVESNSSSNISHVYVEGVFRDTVGGSGVTGAAASATANDIILDLKLDNCGNGLLISQIAITKSLLRVNGTTATSPFESANGAPGLDCNVDLYIQSSAYGISRCIGIVQRDHPILYVLSTGLSSTVSTVSAGPTSSRVRAIEVLGSDLWVVIQSGYELHTPAIIVGDPLKIVGGTAAGKYQIAGVGAVTTAGVPITGALVGDQYVQLSAGALGAGVKTAGDILPGKAIAKLGTVSGAQIRLKAEASARINFGNAFSSATWAGSVYSVTGIEGTPSVASPETAYIPISVDVYNLASNANYVCVFGGATSTEAWLPSFYGQVSAEITASGKGQFLKGILPVKTIP